MRMVLGNVFLNAKGVNSDLVINAAITSIKGNISLLAGHDVQARASMAICSVGYAGTIDVEAIGRSITMANGAEVVTSGGNIRYAAHNDITLGRLLAGSGDVSVLGCDRGVFLMPMAMC